MHLSPCLLGGGYGVGLDWAERIAPADTVKTHPCVTMAAGAAALSADGEELVLSGQC